MKYDLSSLTRLVRDIPYLNGRTGFPPHLWRLAVRLDTYARFLPLADRLRVERLEPLYTHARCLAVFDPAMLEDLVEAFGWRGLARGAWLAGLKAERGCRATLEAIASGGHYPNQQGVVSLALNELDGRADPELAEQHRRISMLREAIRLIPVAPFDLRLHDPDLQDSIDADRDQVSHIYATQGPDVASAFMRARPWAHVLEGAQNTSWHDASTDPTSATNRQVWHWGFIC